MNKNDEKLERRRYSLEEILERFEIDGHQNPVKFIVFEAWLPIPIVVFLYSRWSFMLTVFAIGLLLNAWIFLRHRELGGSLAYFRLLRRRLLTGQKKMPAFNSKA